VLKWLNLSENSWGSTPQPRAWATQFSGRLGSDKIPDELSAKDEQPMHPTRQKVVQLLKERGQASVKELADAVGLTQMAVRHHLNVLYGRNLVVASTVRRKSLPGRPQQLYSLTAAADQLFPENYFRLVDYLLLEVKATLGADGLEKLLRRVASKMTAEAPPIRPGQSSDERLGQVVNFLSDKGFTARWSREGKHCIIRVVTCPYRQVAQVHKEVCQLDAQVIRGLLDADLQQVTCIANGDGHCTFQFSQLS
jgi:predicted ArsR family transcriptional regulator